MTDIKRRVTQKGCSFCASKIDPYYREVGELSRYMSERNKIVASIYTRVCAKHQRQLAQEIKRARHLALLPFSTGV